jgi:hypothetical protein
MTARYLIVVRTITSLAKTMCDGRPPDGTFDLFAVEGGTAAFALLA